LYEKNVKNVNAIRVGIKFHDDHKSVVSISETSGLIADNRCKSVSQCLKTARACSGPALLGLCVIKDVDWQEVT